MKNRKHISFILLLSLLLALFLTGCSKAEEKKELVIYTWADMFPQEVLDGFTEETGIEVIYANFDTSENMLEKMSRGEASSYDIIVTDDYMIDILRNKGLISKLDKSLIPNFGNIDPFYQGYFFDPEDEYTVPYGAGIPLIVYNRNRVDFPVTGYHDLWREEFRDSLALVSSYRVVNAIPLLAMHESINSEDPEVLAKAGEMLRDLAPNVKMMSDSSPHLSLISGEAKAGFLFTSQVNAVLDESDDFVAVFPEEGIGFGIMGAVVSAEAPNRENAMAFLNYILQPDVAAECFDYIGYYATTLPEDGMDAELIPEGLTGEIMRDVSPEANEKLIENYMNFQNAI